MPLYRSVRHGPTIDPQHRPLAAGPDRRTDHPDPALEIEPARSNVPVYLVENSDLFERDDPAQGRGIYHATAHDGGKYDYGDNAYRFLFLPRRDGGDSLPRLRARHPARQRLADRDCCRFISANFIRIGPPIGRLRSLFTIHNIAYQGVFGRHDYHLTGPRLAALQSASARVLRPAQFPQGGHRFRRLGQYGQPDLRSGNSHDLFRLRPRRRAHRTARSAQRHRQRRRLRHLEFGHRSESAGPLRRPKPSTPARRSARRMLQRHFHLPEQPRTPLLGMIARLVEQKGVELSCKAADELLQQDVQLVILGEGDPAVSRQAHRDSAERFPEQGRPADRLRRRPGPPDRSRR